MLRLLSTFEMLQKILGGQSKVVSSGGLSDPGQDLIMDFLFEISKAASCQVPGPSSTKASERKDSC